MLTRKHIVPSFVTGEDVWSSKWLLQWLNRTLALLSFLGRRDVRTENLRKSSTQETSPGTGQSCHSGVCLVYRRAGREQCVSAIITQLSLTF